MYKIKDIAQKIGGEVFGDTEMTVSGISTPEYPENNTVIYVKNKKWLERIPEDIKVCIVAPFNPENSTHNYIIVKKEEKDRAFIELLKLFADVPFENKSGVSQNATVAKDVNIESDVFVGDFTVIEGKVSIGENTLIGSNCYVGKNSRIGKNCIIYPGVKIYPNTILGDRVIIHSGVVIGGDGFGYSLIDGVNTKIPQIGGVLIENDVEIGANTTIDRATIGYTKIGENTKIDNLVQIAHNVEIGKNTIICALCGISGSVKIGNNVVIAGAVGLKDHIVIEDDVYIGAKAGVMEKRVKKGSKLLGIPAIDFRTEMEFIALKPRIKEMWKELTRIKKELSS